MHLRPSLCFVLMRLFFLQSLLVASGASAQSGLSLGMCPATGLGGPATNTEVRGRVGLTSLFSIEPSVGYGVEAGREIVDPFPCDRCGVLSSLGEGESASLTLGGVLALRAPEATLPRPLAEAHMGLLVQWEEVSYSSGALREEGASALMLGVGLAAHSGHFRTVGLPLADAYVGTSFYYVG